MGWMSNALDTLRKAVDGVLGFFKKIGEGVKNAFSKVKKGFEAVGERVASVFAEPSRGEAWDEVSDKLASLKDRWVVLASVERTYGKSLETMFAQATPEQASKAGGKLIEAIAQGMDANGKLLPGTLVKILQIVDEYLPHSPAKRGPLARLGEVGPGFIQTISKGLEQKKNELIKAGQDTAYNLKTAFEEEAKKPMGDVMTTFLSNIGLGDATKVAKDFWGQFTGFLQSDVGKQVDSALGGILSGSVQMIASVFGGPAGATIAGSLMSALNVAFKLFGKQKWFKQAIYPIQKAFKDVWRDLRKPFRELQEALAPLLKIGSKFLAILVKLGAAVFIKPLLKSLQLIAEILSPIITPVIEFLTWIDEALSNLIDWLNNVIESMDILSWIFNAMKSALNAIWKVIKPIADAVGNFVSFVAKILGAVGGWIGGIIKGILGKLFGFAEGGLVEGPGTSKSDNIVARLSPGEFVVNAEATKQYLPLLEAINEGKEIPPTYGNVNLTVNVYEATNPKAVVQAIKQELAKARIAVG